jgi:hypothetical protein
MNQFSLIDVRGAERFNEAREAFLLSIPDEDREEVDMICRAYDSTRNDCGLNSTEKVVLAGLLAKYPAMNQWLF